MIATRCKVLAAVLMAMFLVAGGGAHAAGDTPTGVVVKAAQTVVNHQGLPLQPSSSEVALMRDMPYSEALRRAKAGEVDEILVRAGRGLPVMFVRTADGKVFKSMMPTYRLDDAWTETGVTIRADNGGPFTETITRLNDFVSFAFGIVLIIMVTGMAGKMMRAPTRDGVKAAKVDRIGFADVAGLTEAKKELMEIVEFLKFPKKFEELGARVPKGCLLEGPAGNGKTLLAKAIAGESGVPFYHIDGPEILEMFAGLGARRIRKTFAQCRRRSLADKIAGREATCILFIDEIDAIGGRRSMGGGDSATSEREQILNQLLVEMDGVGKRGNVIVVVATNRADMLDPALTRPGRLDRRIVVGRPDLAGRLAIAAVHARKVKLAPGFDLKDVARMTAGFSGADVANLVNEAAIQAARANKQAVDLDSFHAARDRQIMGVERPSEGMLEEERNVAAYHEAGHAIVALRSKHSDPVEKITIIPRGLSLGAVIRMPERDRYLMSRGKIEDDLAVGMAGRAAEALVLGEDSVTSGASGDIETCTLLAREMLGRWGMSRTLGRVSYLGTFDGRGVASSASLARLDEEVKVVIDEAYDRAFQILSTERVALDALVRRLRTVETMTGGEALELINKAQMDQAAVDAAA